MSKNKRLTKDGASQTLTGFALCALALAFAVISVIAFNDIDASAIIFSLVVALGASIAGFIFFSFPAIKNFISAIKNGEPIPQTAFILGLAQVCFDLLCIIFIVVFLILNLLGFPIQ